MVAFLERGCAKRTRGKARRHGSTELAAGTTAIEQEHPEGKHYSVRAVRPADELRTAFPAGSFKSSRARRSAASNQNAADPMPKACGDT
jgi:hypothetical protein